MNITVKELIKALTVYYKDVLDNPDDFELDEWATPKELSKQVVNKILSIIVEGTK